LTNPPPGQAGCLVPTDIISKFNDRVRKREQRRKEADEAAAKRAAADAELRARLLATCNGNYLPGPGLDDMTPIKAILELVPVDYILYAIRQKVDKRCFPGNPPLASWRDPKFLRAVADNYCGGVVIPSMVAAWEAAGKAPATKAHGSSPPAGHTPADIDNLRSHHDLEHAPPGPHSRPKPPAASAAPDVTGKPVERVEPSPAVPKVPAAPENAPAVPPAQPVANPDDGPAGSAGAAEPLHVVDADRIGSPSRESILAAFNRNRTPPQPAPQPVPQPRPPERQAEQISDEGWEELIAGFMAGMVNWNTRRFGPEPGQPGCRAPRNILRSFGL